MRVFVVAALVAIASGGLHPRLAVAQDDKVKMAMKLVEEAGAAYEAGKNKEAAALAKKAVELDPANPAAQLVLGSALVKLRDFDGAKAAFRDLIRLDPRSAGAHMRLGEVLLALRDNEAAVACFREVLRLDPKMVEAHDRLGDALLKLGKFDEAVACFDQFLKVNPKFAPDHWRRGIALYYAGKFKEGVDQFELHRKVNPEDVENSAWHYLCNARANSPKKAREDLIPVTKDSRVPMAQVLQLFAGKLKPQDVLDAAEKAKLKDEDLKEARFYANLYAALYYESEGDAKKALEHLTTAVEKYKIGHYMWDVGDAHLKLLKAKK